jgi:osmoprotectant transport system substrate-binding protein
MLVTLRHLSKLALLATAALAAAVATAQQPVRVGSKNFTEQFVLAELYAQALEAAGIMVER